LQLQFEFQLFQSFGALWSNRNFKPDAHRLRFDQTKFKFFVQP